MSARIVFLPQAERDVLEVFAWYEAQRSGLGDALLRRMHERIALIRDNPRCYPVVMETVRRAALKQFPYGIYYEEHGDCE